MITETMDKDEVIGQFRKDFSDGLKAFINYKGAEWLKVRKRLLPKQCGYKIYPFSMDRQKYLLTYHKSRDLMNVRNSMSIVAVVDGVTPSYYLVALTGDVFILTTHFFSRYAERTGFKFTPHEAIGRFLVENPYQQAIYWKGGRIVYACKQGIVLAEWDKKRNIIVWRTFVSLQMLKETQREAYDKVSTLLDRLGQIYSKAMTEEQLLLFNDYLQDITKDISMDAMEIYAKFWEE